MPKRLESLGLSCGAAFAGRSWPFFKRLLMLRTLDDLNGVIRVTDASYRYNDKVVETSQSLKVKI